MSFSWSCFTSSVHLPRWICYLAASPTFLLENPPTGELVPARPFGLSTLDPGHWTRRPPWATSAPHCGFHPCHGNRPDVSTSSRLLPLLPASTPPPHHRPPPPPAAAAARGGTISGDIASSMPYPSLTLSSPLLVCYPAVMTATLYLHLLRPTIIQPQYSSSASGFPTHPPPKTCCLQ